MSNKGWIKLHRSVFDTPATSKDADHISIWVYLLINASHKECKSYFGKDKISLYPGQLIVGRKAIAGALKINEYKVQRVLNEFENDNQITQIMGNKSRLVTIIKWSEYQNDDYATQVQRKCNASAQQDATQVHNRMHIKNEEKTSVELEKNKKSAHQNAIQMHSKVQRKCNASATQVHTIQEIKNKIIKEQTPPNPPIEKSEETENGVGGFYKNISKDENRSSGNDLVNYPDEKRRDELLNKYIEIQQSMGKKINNIGGYKRVLIQRYNESGNWDEVEDLITEHIALEDINRKNESIKKNQSICKLCNSDGCVEVYTEDSGNVEWSTGKNFHVIPCICQEKWSRDEFEKFVNIDLDYPNVSNSKLIVSRKRDIMVNFTHNFDMINSLN